MGVDPVAELARIQGPARHSWWSFWVGVGGWCYKASILGSGKGSPSWVLGNLFCGMAKVERWTR